MARPSKCVSQRKRGSTASGLEQSFLFQVESCGLSNGLLLEHPFAREIGRRWRFDFAWPDYAIAVELEGGIWANGRHTRGLGFESDCEKYNAATALGWRIFRFTPGMVRDGRALAWVSALLSEGGEPISQDVIH